LERLAGDQENISPNDANIGNTAIENNNPTFSMDIKF